MLINDYINSIRGTGLSVDEIIDALRQGSFELWRGIICAPTSEGVILRTTGKQLNVVRLRYSIHFNNMLTYSNKANTM